MTQTFPQLQRSSQLLLPFAKSHRQIALIHSLKEVDHVVVIAAVESVLEKQRILKRGVGDHFVLVWKELCLLRLLDPSGKLKGEGDFFQLGAFDVVDFQPKEIYFHMIYALGVAGLCLQHYFVVGDDVGVAELVHEFGAGV